MAPAQDMPRGGERRRTDRESVRERRLLRAARRGDAAARDRLTVAHLGLVRRIAARYRGLGLAFDDLVQEGSIGLLDAIDRYDPHRGVAFEVFARFRIRRAILNALTEQARFVRLPKQVVERRRLLDRMESRLAASTGHMPSAAELAAAAALPVDAVLEARSAAITPASLSEPAQPNAPALESVVGDPAATPETDAVRADEARRVRGAVERLSPRQREIVSRHFGLDGSETPIATVAADLHLSERRTRTIENDALYRLALELERS